MADVARNRKFTSEEADKLLKRLIEQQEQMYLANSLHGVCTTLTVDIAGDDPFGHVDTMSHTLIVGCAEHNIAASARFFAQGINMEYLGMFTAIFHAEVAKRLDRIANLGKSGMPVTKDSAAEAAPVASDADANKLLAMPLPKGSTKAN